MELTSEAGYFIVGSTNFIDTSRYSNGIIPPTDISDFYYLRLSSTGIKLQEGTQGLNYADHAVNAIVLNREYGILGTTSTGNETNIKFFIINETSTVPLNNETYGTGSNEVSKKIIKASDNYFIVCGDNRSTDGTSSNIIFVKLQQLSNNSIQSSEIVHIKDKNFTSISVEASTLLTTGELIHLGKVERQSSSDIYLVKTDMQGNIIWSNTFGSLDSNEFGEAIITTSDGGLAILGTTSFDKGNTMICLIKTNPEGKLKP